MAGRFIKPCNQCGQEIELRKNRYGGWTAFEVNSSIIHKCGDALDRARSLFVPKDDPWKKPSRPRKRNLDDLE